MTNHRLEILNGTNKDIVKIIDVLYNEGWAVIAMSKPQLSESLINRLSIVILLKRKIVTGISKTGFFELHSDYDTDLICPNVSCGYPLDHAKSLTYDLANGGQIKLELYDCHKCDEQLMITQPPKGEYFEL